MTTWFHSMILATSAVATIAVGVAGATAYGEMSAKVSKKADRLMSVADNSGSPEITVEQRTNGVSILTRVPAPTPN